jgi:hypothetical protein
MLNQMKQMVQFFAARCSDRSTLDELHRMIENEHSWYKAHDLFDRIRNKTLDAAERRDEWAECQYLFEEACAKTLYNLTGRPAPFDADSPYWIVPNALVTAKHFEIEEREIVRAIVA